MKDPIGVNASADTYAYADADADAPPSYTNDSPSYSAVQVSEKKESYREPVYFQSASPQGWTVIITNKFWTDGFQIFISRDSYEKYNVFRKSQNQDIPVIQQQGVGIPLFKVINTFFSIGTTFLTFRKYCPPPLDSQGVPQRFDPKRDYHEFCIVKKRFHVGYDSYIFEFHPDPYDLKKRNFTFTMFSHSVLPIHDYIYKDERHRWIDESRMEEIVSLWQVKYGFKHTVLRPDQPSMCDNWDGQNDKLVKSTPNPLLNGLWKKKLSVRAHYPELSQYGQHCSAILGEAANWFQLGYAEVKVDDIYNNLNGNNVNYESILSVNEDALVMICVATVLKRQKDIVEDRKKRS